MIRKLFALAVVFMAPVAAGAQDAGGWRGGAGAEGSFAASPACPGCTAPGLNFVCRSADKSVRLWIGLPLSQGAEGSAVDLIFSVDGLIDVRRGFRRSDPRAGLLGTTDITVDDGLIAALKLGRTVTVTVDDQTFQMALGGSADAFKEMRSACGVAPVPVREN